MIWHMPDIVPTVLIAPIVLIALGTADMSLISPTSLISLTVQAEVHMVAMGTVRLHIVMFLRTAAHLQYRQQRQYRQQWQYRQQRRHRKQQQFPMIYRFRRHHHRCQTLISASA